MHNIELPDRYAVRHSRVNGRPYLDDGSNFVRWVDDMTDAEIRAVALASIEARERRTNDYVAAMNAAIADGTYAAGWQHAGCDHASGICTG